MIKLKNLSPEENKELLLDDLIFLGYRGSIAHGLYIPNNNPNSVDDKDVIGIYIAKSSHYLGIFKQKETIEKWVKEYDSVYYEFIKIVKLLLKGNPNVLSILWMDEKNYIFITDYFKQLIINRELFVSKQAYHSFVGYAYGQFHRMIHMKFDGYMGTKRKQLVEKYGYDCKNASHLIRLLKMGIEFLNEGKLYVERTSDSQQLLEIKNGLWTLEQVKNEAERLFKICEQAYLNTKLPNDCNLVAIDKLCQNIIKSYLGKNT